MGQEIREGVVTTWDLHLSFGWLAVVGVSGRVFVHRSALTARERLRLDVGEHVECEVAESPRGPRAVNVRVVGADGGVVA